MNEAQLADAFNTAHRDVTDSSARQRIRDASYLAQDTAALWDKEQSAMNHQ